MAAAQKKRTTTRKKETTQQAVRKKTTSTAGKRERTQEMEIQKFIPKEILILIAFAVSVLVFLSNLHLCGSFGEVIRKGVLGVFGILGYVVPVYLFGAMLFYISNRRNVLAVAKLIASAILFLLLCGLCQLIGKGTYNPDLTLGEYFTAGSSGFNGGFIGGLFSKSFQASFGMLGSIVILLVLSAICLVFITERSILKPIRRGTDRVYQNAREDARRFRDSQKERMEEKKIQKERERELKREEKARKRVERPVYGVALSDATALSKDQEEASQEDVTVPFQQDSNLEEEGKEAEAVPSFEDIDEKKEEPAREKQERKIPIIREGKAYVDEPEEEMDILREDAIHIRQDTRTLGELEAIDSLPNIFNQGRRLDPMIKRPVAEPVIEPEPTIGSEPAIGWEPAVEPEPMTEPERMIKPETADRRETAAALEEVNPFQAEEPVEEAQEENPEISPLSRFRRSTQVDTKRVVTASGKVLEVEVKPEDLVEGVESSNLRSGGEGIWRDPAKDPGSASAGKSFTQPGAAPKAPKKEKKPYVFPPVELLKPAQGGNRENRDKELRETAQKLEQTLRNFGVGISITNISCGPAVTRYELLPEQGVKVSKIVSLSDDIKLSLAAADIRIEAPIPGKSAVGIEVPNKENSIVSFRELIESQEFKKFPSKLAFAVGKDIGGQIIVTDMAKMPHLLIAGATGSGKSVCINTLIMSIIYKADPEEVKVIMIDPKVVELSVYNGIPHLMIPVVTDPKKAAGALNWAVAEMTDRYKKFADYNVRDLKGYNEKISQEVTADGEHLPRLPQIVIIVDELADLMMVAPGDVEDAICRLAQMARAAGIHLVIATQRPSVNVITGLIKANVPSRIAFAVSSGVDSRTIIDMNGAEKLLGKGDMLFYPYGYQKPVRVQGAFISDKEVSSVVEFLTSQGGGATYDADIESRLAAASESGGGESASSGTERDSYFAEAGKFIIEKDKASIGMLQRVFRIGFNRAARIVDQLAEAGVVGEEEGTKPRKVLMTMEQFDELLKQM